MRSRGLCGEFPNWIHMTRWESTSVPKTTGTWSIWWGNKKRYRLRGRIFGSDMIKFAAVEQWNRMGKRVTRIFTNGITCRALVAALGLVACGAVFGQDAGGLDV